MSFSRRFEELLEKEIDKEMNTPTQETGTKYDSGKPDLALLPTCAIMEIGKVLTFGANKYDSDNWRKGFNHRRLVSASLRHIFKYLDGQDLDEESGLLEIAHAATNLLFLLEHQIKGYGKDDRYGNNT